VLDRDKKGTTHKGYMWCYYSPPLEMVLFDYQPSRDGTSMRETLKGYQGTIQCDGYSTYETVWAQDPAVTLIHCWAHVRRKFFEAASSSAVLSDEAMTFIGALYQIERCGKEAALNPDQVRAMREEKALPILARFKQWMIEVYPTLNPTEPVRKAIDYTLPRWKELVHYTTDGTLAIDNNGAENAIRPVCVGYAKQSIM